MTAQIVDMGCARKRFASRIAERAEERSAPSLEASRRRWRTDLATWPSTFQENVSLYLAEPADYMSIGMSKPGEITRSVYRSGGRHLAIEAARVRPIEPDALLEAIRLHREHAREKVRAIESWHRDRNLDRRRFVDHKTNETRWTARELQLLLWLHGVRRIDRAGLRAAAQRYVASEEAKLGDEIAYRRDCAERQRAALASGRVQSGRNAGKPYTKLGALAAKGRAASRERELQALEWKLAHVFPWAHANPVKYATGCLPRRAREGRAIDASDAQHAPATRALP